MRLFAPQKLLASLYCVLCILSLPMKAHAAQKVLYITFDDGPSERYTPKILDVLRREHVRATFFVLGFRSEQYPHLVRRMIQDGHEIGNHGYYHQTIANKADEWVRQDVLRADAVIRKAGGVSPVLYRPPGGIINPHEVSLIEHEGHPVVLWTLDSRDWKTSSTKSIVGNVMNGLKPGAIILFHDGVSNSRYTLEALPEIIKQCHTRGYVFRVLPTHG